MAWLVRDQPHSEVQRIAWKNVGISGGVIITIVSALEHELTHACIHVCMLVFNASSYPKPWPTLVKPASITCTIGTIGRPCVADVIKLLSDKAFIRNALKDI
jgi:hypothetical protein